MPYVLPNTRNKRKARKTINIHQNKFPKAYVSTIDNSRRPVESLSDMTNMELVQDNVVRPRPPLIRYGTQPANPVIGRGHFTQSSSRYIMWMQDAIYYNTGTASQSTTTVTGTGTAFIAAMVGMDIVWDSGETAVITAVGSGTSLTVGTSQTVAGGAYAIYTGTAYKQTDGGSFTAFGGSENTFDNSAWAGCVQSYDSINSVSKLYIYNGVDNLAYVNLDTDAVVKFSSLATPTPSTAVYTGGADNSQHFYRVSANNKVGESIASAAFSTTALCKPRDNWIDQTDYVTVTWNAVTGASSYTIYYGNTAATTNELYTQPGQATTSYKDYGTSAVNPFKLAPEGNSTLGAIFTHMYVDGKNSQIFGVTADNLLYFSAPGTGDFSPYNGGGWVAIDEFGDTTLNYVTGFRNGKGDPVITVSARGAAGKGRLYHVSFETLTVGDQAIVYPNVYEANGQSGTYAPRATIKNADSITYPTGQDFKSTGTSQNIVNILTTNTVSQGIIPDVDRISLASLSKAVGVEYQDKLYFALPVGSTENNEIWYLDTSRKNAWVLRWPIKAKDMWLYEDSSGYTHFNVLVNNIILEFTRTGAQLHQDDNVAWRSRTAFESLVWDEDGLTLGKIRRHYIKLLQPKGTITANDTGLTRSGASTAAGSDSFTVTTTATGIGAWQYGGAFLGKDAAYKYGDDPGDISSYGKSIAVLQIKPKGLLAELGWELIGDTAGTDYILSASNVKGFALEDLVLNTD